jgi:hypothetical protein
VHDTFHEIIPGQASTPIGPIDLQVSYGTGENKRTKMLTFGLLVSISGTTVFLGGLSS